MTFLDEFASEVAPISAPDLAREFGLPTGLTAGLVVSAYAALALFVEAPLLAWAERRGRVGRVSALALAALAFSLALLAAAPNAAWMLTALALYGPASGVALAAADGTLVEANPAERERTLARLTLAGIAGALLAPLLLIAGRPAGLGWRAVAVLAACLSLALAWQLARSPALDRPLAFAEGCAEREGDARPPLRELAHVARAHPQLLGWLGVAAAAGLLDELLVAFASAHLSTFAAASAPQRLLALTAWTIGDAAGALALTAALARARPLPILKIAALGAGVSLAAFWLTRDVAVAAFALGLLGASSITFHPLLMARAYAALPGRPALVAACAALLQPASAAAPLVLAWLATSRGPAAAIAALGVAPLLVGVAAFCARDREAR